MSLKLQGFKEGTVVTAAVVIGTHSSAFTYDPPPIVALAAGGKQGQGKCFTCIVFDLRHMKCWVSVHEYTHARAFESIALAQSRPISRLLNLLWRLLLFLFPTGAQFSRTVGPGFHNRVW